MAEALTALQDLKECPVCRDEFTDPRALPCDHSLCQDCIDHIKRGLQIRCPVCTAVHDVRKVRRDFRLMQFLDVIKEEREAKAAKTKDGEPHCDVCSAESATHWCKDCQQWLCNGCKNTHSKIASCKNHTIETLSAKVSEIKSKYDKEAKLIKEKIQHYTTAAKKIEERIGSLEMTQMEAIELSDGLRNKCIKDIQDFFDSIDAKILGFIQEKISDLENNRKKLLTELQGIEMKWKHLEEMIEENSRKLVVDGQAIIDQAKRIKDSYVDFKVRADDVSIKVKKGSSWQPSTAAVLHINGGGAARAAGVIHSQPTLCRLASLTDKRFNQNDMVQLKHTPWCMRLIEDKLWVCESNGTIEVFDKNLKLIKKLENKAWEYVNDIVAIPGNGLVVVSSKALFHIDSSSKKIQNIDSGYYYSGIFHKETLFAYEDNTNGIVSYKYSRSWENKNTITLSYGNWNTLSVTDNTITVCSFNDGKINVLNHTGQVLHTYGEWGSGSAGKLSGPLLCQEDDEGALLVADRDNDRLQVLDRQRTWSTVNMQPAVKDPMRAVYTDGVLYVVSFSDNKLYAYTEK